MNRNTAASAKTTTAAKTRVARAIPHEEAKPEIADQSVFKQMFDEAFAEIAGFEMPSWQRTLCALVVTLAVGVGVTMSANVVLGWLMAGALLASVPYFLAVAVYLLGVIIACFFGAKLAAWAGGAVLTGRADEAAVKQYDKTKALIKRLNPFGERKVVAA